ncbi:MAG: DUF2927 domain-containing protein [Rhodobacterales bacterium]|nr:MAG: DUF2927 domain-containing protein [Rhodobacterales bacterium]
MPSRGGCFRVAVMMIRAFAVILCLLASPLMAEAPQTDGVAVKGVLPDAALYRLATCGAPPGGACQGKVLRWQKPRLTLRIDPGDDVLPPGFVDRLGTALTSAIREVNVAGAGIRLEMTDATEADITIRPTTLADGTVLTASPGFSGRGTMGVGYMTVWYDRSNRIVEAVILISTSITDDDLPSVMLEEVTQSLGFLYDIEGPAYEGVSILSQTSNATVTLTGQDTTLLRLHYPPP